MAVSLHCDRWLQDSPEKLSSSLPKSSLAHQRFNFIEYFKLQDERQKAV